MSATRRHPRPGRTRSALRLVLTLAVVALLALSVAMTGCGGDDDDDADSKTGRTDATDTRPPRDVVAGSPEAAIERLWRWLRLGSPTAITAYDPALVRSVGRDDMAAALTALRAPVERTELSLSGTEATALGMQVAVEQEAEGAEPRELVYLLLRKRDKWVVSFDGLLKENLVATATAKASQKALAKTRTKPGEESPRARLAAAVASADASRQVLAAIDPSPPSAQVPEDPDPAESPEAALDRLWNAIRLGSPAALASYSPRTVGVLGSTDMLVSLQNLGGVLSNADLEITDLEETELGTLATVRRSLEDEEPRDSAYLLDRGGKNWVVAYDAMLGETMVATATGQATTSAQAKADPDAKETSPAAQAAGVKAGARVQQKLARLGAPAP